MQYREFTPSPQLADCIKCLWNLEAEPGLPVQTIYPDGCAEIVFQYGDHFLKQPRSVFAGQIYEHLKIVPSGRTGTFGVRFHTQGAARFFNQPQSEFTGSLYSLEEIWGTAGSSLEQKVLEGKSAAARVAIVERALIARKSDRPAPPILTAALNHIQSIPIREICATLTVSPRQLERLFQREVGLNPKLYARIRRFQQALQQKGSAWCHVAYDCGYYDQAHLIHDFVEFTGHPHPPVPHLDQRCLSHSYKTTSSFRHKLNLMDIAQLVFMAGCWVNGPTEEVWLKPAGGSMLGISRTVKDGKTTFTEYMQVVEEEGTLVMKVQLRLAGKLTAFKLISLTNQQATFSNPEHDFPQRIIYRREPGGSLFARIEGNLNGKPAHEDYPMKRTSCD